MEILQRYEIDFGLVYGVLLRVVTSWLKDGTVASFYQATLVYNLRLLDHSCALNLLLLVVNNMWINPLIGHHALKSTILRHLYKAI